MVTMFTFMLSTQAMTYPQAREQALFLTDKMAYELNLTQEQYEAAYEINLDYFMSIGGVNDVYAAPWRQRNLDLSYILYDWQYAAYEAAAYFFRPVFWSAGYWHFGIYSHDPDRTHVYFARPVTYNAYLGGHSWRRNGGRSWYVAHTQHYRPALTSRNHYSGLRDTHHHNNHHNNHAPAHVNNHRNNNHVDYNRNDNRTYNRAGNNNADRSIRTDNGNRNNNRNANVNRRNYFNGNSNTGAAQRSSTRETSGMQRHTSTNRSRL